MRPPIKRALVTGATGFIGSRTVEVLQARGIAVRALCRHPFGTRTGAGATGVERVHGDVTRPETLARAVAGCDVVFHCAWGGTSLADARRVNVDGTRHVVEAAAAAHVRRIVHLSSMAVHGTVRRPELTEEAPLVDRGDAYSVSKAEGERLALELGRARGVEVVALRPSLVYGPGSPFWLVEYFERVRDEHVTLVRGGAGLANLVFVDDVVDAMLAAATAPVADVACLVSGERPVTWATYLGAFARMCRKPLPRGVPLWRAWIEMHVMRVYGTLAQRPRRLRAADVRLMAQRTAVRIDRARRLLAWSPATSFEAGMGICESWLRREGYLPPAPVEARVEARR
jgi:nucleoside-diphosphate-sugar epimerase